ncbi:hypothetical protein MNBD_PLANCTO03-1113 [hydrothermal vent metagenome]|uniref:Uncharacterized protein n=1 Tax=hydrothermal vent metagenome TaxID=652676 RepID=A0A3B1DT88_9ZZZZ
MAELPETILGQLQYFEQHIPVWASDPAAIGLTIAQIADITSLTGAMRVAYNNSQASRQTSKDDTLLQRIAHHDMLGLGTALIATIKAFDDASGSTGAILAAASIAIDNAASPFGPPIVATEFVTSLHNSGAIEIRWKGTVANGTYYTIHRKLDSETDFALIGNASDREFTDATIPAGTPKATYYLITHRDALNSGQSEHITVNLGVGGSVGGLGNEGESSGSMGLAA